MDKSVNTYSPLALAYLGDAVYELVIREWILQNHNTTPKEMNKAAVRCVSARAQAAAAEKILPLLNAEEADILRRGRNAHPGTTSRHASVKEYRSATALEALTGYLYLTGQKERLKELILAGLAENEI